MISLREENFLGRELIFKVAIVIVLLFLDLYPFIKFKASGASISGKISSDSVSTGLSFTVLMVVCAQAVPV